MNDSQLFAIIISSVNSMRAEAGIPDLLVKQTFQPTQQGVNTLPTAYLFKIGDRRYGYPDFTEIWDAENSVMRHQTTQRYESTFQFSALATQNPKTPDQFTASDILNRVAYILQSSTIVATLEAQGIGVLRVMDIRNPYFTDDRSRNEASPSFDFIITHKQIILSTSPIITKTELNILEI